MRKGLDIYRPCSFSWCGYTERNTTPHSIKSFASYRGSTVSCRLLTGVDSDQLFFSRLSFRSPSVFNASKMKQLSVVSRFLTMFAVMHWMLKAFPYGNNVPSLITNPLERFGQFISGILEPTMERNTFAAPEAFMTTVIPQFLQHNDHSCLLNDLIS